MASRQDIRRFEANLQKEREGAAVYAALAQSEKDPNLANLYAKLAAVEVAFPVGTKAMLRALEEGRDPGADGIVLI